MNREELIGVDRPGDWAAALEGLPHGFWHGWAACKAASLSAGWPAFLYVAHIDGSRVVCPLLEREWHGHIDFATPIGFSGFAASASELPKMFSAQWAAFMRSRRAVCAYLALHPLYAPQGIQPDQFEGSTLYVLDLSQGPEQWLQGVDKNRSRSIRAWERSGRTWIRERSVLCEFVVRHHEQFMRSARASDASFHSGAALELLCTDEHVELAGVEDEQGVCTVAGFGATPWGCELLFHISVRDGRDHSAALMWWAVRHYHRIGMKVLNLGGSAREDDPLAAAKRRYRPREVPFRALKQVFDRVTYERLCDQAGEAAADLAGYFPAYRRPSRREPRTFEGMQIV